MPTRAELLTGCVEPALDRCHLGAMRHATLYDDPHLYDLLVPPGPCERFYRALAHRTGGPILELACGTGRLTIPLATDGHDVIGLDASDCMLRRARAKAAAAGVPISLVQGDMRSFDMGQRFALVIVSCNSLGHLTGNDDLRTCLRTIKQHLAPGGLLAFDINHPNVRELALAREQHAVRCNTGEVNITQALSYDALHQITVSEWFVSGPLAERQLAPLVLRQVFPQELALLLEAAGLELAARHGDFDGHAFEANSMNQVCVARAKHAV